MEQEAGCFSSQVPAALELQGRDVRLPLQFRALSSTQIQVCCKILIPTGTEGRKGAGGSSWYNQGAAPVIPLYLFTFYSPSP